MIDQNSLIHVNLSDRIGLDIPLNDHQNLIVVINPRFKNTSSFIMRPARAADKNQHKHFLKIRNEIMQTEFNGPRTNLNSETQLLGKVQIFH